MEIAEILTPSFMGGATIGSGGYKYPPLSKVYPPPGGTGGTNWSPTNVMVSFKNNVLDSIKDIVFE